MKFIRMLVFSDFLLSDIFKFYLGLVVICNGNVEIGILDGFIFVYLVVIILSDKKDWVWLLLMKIF